MESKLSQTLEIDSAITLAQASVGCDFRVKMLAGSAETCRRLRAIGFCEEMKVRKMSNGKNLVCTVCGTRLAMSRELAECVLVG